MDPFELLKADHKKVAQLFDKLEAASGKAKLDVFKKIKSELELHTHIEETIFYPALKTPEETHDLTLEAYEEHKVVKRLLSELTAATSANEEWKAKATVLRENVEHHVDEEENELFDKADDALSDEQIESLGEQMEAEKARKQGRPSPKNPAARGAKSSEAKAGKSILSKIADFVGLGGGTSESNPSKKSSTRKSPAAGKGSISNSKATATAKKVNTASKKRAGKSSKATGSTSSSAGAMKASNTRSSAGAKNRKATASVKKAATKGAKNRTRRK